MTNKILKHTLLFSSFVLLAQIFGLVRDLYLVKIFGVGQILDTYYLAFKIPDLMNVFYSVFLGSVIFIPLLTKVKTEYEKKGEVGSVGILKEVNKIGSLVLILVTFIAVLLFISMPYLSKLLAPTWDFEQLKLLTDISRTLLLAQFFFPVGILAGAIGMVHFKPLGSAIAGFTYNIFILIFSFLLAPVFGIYGVVYAVILSAFLFMCVQFISK
jgi:putative peptidoglycan lipid II flippase